MLRRITGVLLLALALVLGWAATQPDSFRIERKITIDAPPARIFPLINDYRGWALWSPWEKKDPAMKRTHSGADTGVGAVYEWSGNSEVGSGRMEIIQSVPDSRIAIDLHFMTPFEARNTTEFMLEPKDGGTVVTWAMFGPSPFISKLMGLFMSMDTMVGGDFEAGLAALKARSEQDG
ncbi:MAG: SRPBCC family protein [Gammaproteobacteria bacterium]